MNTNTLDTPVETAAALRFITCGSVDDGKSTLIGRLLVDTRAVLSDQLAGVQRSGATDLALLTDGLSAEREQGITIDVAYRYFATASRKFIIGDAPGHEQYTRNMVTAASSADAAVVLVDASKLPWASADTGAAHELLPQTRRHSLLVHLLRVPSVIFAVNKLDAVEHPEQAFERIRAALQAFAAQAGIEVTATVPMSALEGWNVVDPRTGWAGYSGPSLLQILEGLPVTPADTALPFAFPVQWVEKFSASADTQKGRRVFWGRINAGSVAAGQDLVVMPSGATARVAQVLDHARQEQPSIAAGHSAGIVLDREVDVSRGDWLLAAGAFQAERTLRATVAWLDDEALVPGRVYWALHGHRWVKAKVARIVDRLDIQTLERLPAERLEANSLGHIELALQEPLATLPFADSRTLGALVLVDTASHRTAGAVFADR
ncbi:sulfate adenylyltransferase [Xylophilus rhododendri]|uniref:sulfate adenylyltransferase n=1 Tax=Xylophilus rhododendri TaxID=2697032 RepID=A0A857IYQ4_9BURK|nr:GTP-binding protein [Xylophilus rhododendri]QHI96586.1 sulfate adenylyltransferase [Xylophilus rhododendri]